MPTLRSGNKVVLAITDGLGYDYQLQLEILTNVLRRAKLAATVGDYVRSEYADLLDESVDPEMLAASCLSPIHAEALGSDLATNRAERMLACCGDVQRMLSERGLLESVKDLIHSEAIDRRYIPYIVDYGAMARFRNRHLTIPTHSSGYWVGFEDADPPVQGNSEAGHQQIGSFALAPQISLKISSDIKDGSFFDNEILLNTLTKAVAEDRQINFSFMISGTSGSDGLVHSNWYHLEAFLKMAFEVCKVPPQSLRMLAILDGRDSSSTGSVDIDARGTGRYLYRLAELLRGYDADECLGWIIGRDYAMDRDFQEQNARVLWGLLADGEGLVANSIDAAIELVSSEHREQNLTDTQMPAICLARPDGTPNRMGHNDTFVNLNFRPDRQRCVTALLAGASDFLAREAQIRKREWGFTPAVDGDFNISYISLVNYDPALDKLPNVSAMYDVEALPFNLLDVLPSLVPEMKYTLVGESIKSAHIGYFIRGCREYPTHPQNEIRHIIPSLGSAAGIKNDSDIYLQPEMRSSEVADRVIEGILNSDSSLIICNFAATDMVGHLLPKRFDAALEAYRHTVSCVLKLGQATLDASAVFIWTSDHGNIESDTPSHTANNVLTTIASASKKYGYAPGDLLHARLFDLPKTVLQLLGGSKLANRPLIESNLPIGRCLIFAD